MRREEHLIHSKILNIDLNYVGFGEGGRPLIMFPTSNGRYNENEDFGLVKAVEDKIEVGDIQVFCIDSVNRESWADDSLPPKEKLRRHQLFDRFLSEELFPELSRRSGRDDPIVYGASAGAWQAATFSARHPEQVGRCVAFSGFYDLRQLLDGWWSEDCYYFSPADFISNMDEEWCQRLSRVGWVVATGDGDQLVSETKNFAAVLRKKGISVHEEVWPGVFGHDWPFWCEHLPNFVP